MTIKIRLTVLALAAAVLTTGTALAGTATDPVLDKIKKPGEVTAQKQAPTAGTTVGSITKKLSTGEIGTIIGQEKPPTIQPVQACIAGQPCNLPTPKPPIIQPVHLCILGQPCNLPTPPKPPVTPPHPPICPLDGHCDGPPRGPGPMGDNGHHDGYGYGWRDRPEVVIEGAPAAVVVPAPVAVPERVPVAQPVAAQEPCNCLTKQTLPDGSVLFQDICTKQSALAPAPAPAAQ